MKAYEEVDVLVYIRVFLALALAGFTPGEIIPGTHWIGGWLGPRTGPDDVESRKILHLSGLELQPFGRRTRSQSLYRLRYSGSI
jgi:hypothetical protein